ncbi:MAG: hypothetical protein V3T05_01565, partial [Myxococcota bacterium]
MWENRHDTVRPPRRRRGLVLRLLLALSLLAGCDGSLGCIACGDGYIYPDPPPPGGEIQAATLIAHLQESGVYFIATHLADIIRSRFPTRMDNQGVERAMIYLSEPDPPIGGAGFSLTFRDGCDGPDDPASCTTFETYRSRIEL